MPKLAVTLNCRKDGFTKLTLSFAAQRTGSNNDRYEMRIVRRDASLAEADAVAAQVILPGTPRFVLTSQEDVRSYSWVDPIIENDGTYTYLLQVRRIEGAGEFYEMNLIAEHYKK